MAITKKCFFYAKIIWVQQVVLIVFLNQMCWGLMMVMMIIRMVVYWPVGKVSGGGVFIVFYFLHMQWGKSICFINKQYSIISFTNGCKNIVSIPFLFGIVNNAYCSLAHQFVAFGAIIFFPIIIIIIFTHVIVFLK